MKLTFPQKIAVVLSLLWVSVLMAMTIVDPRVGFSETIIATILGPLFILWISGALKPLIQWFKGAEQ